MSIFDNEKHIFDIIIARNRISGFSEHVEDNPGEDGDEIVNISSGSEIIALDIYSKFRVSLRQLVNIQSVSNTIEPLRPILLIIFLTILLSIE